VVCVHVYVGSVAAWGHLRVGASNNADIFCVLDGSLVLKAQRGPSSRQE
jgi:hypothetical protein